MRVGRPAPTHGLALIHSVVLCLQATDKFGRRVCIPFFDQSIFVRGSPTSLPAGALFVPACYRAHVSVGWRLLVGRPERSSQRWV